MKCVPAVPAKPKVVIQCEMQLVRRYAFAMKLHDCKTERIYAESSVSLLNETLKEMGFTEEPTANWHKTRNTCWRKHGYTVSNVYGIFRSAKYPVHVYADTGVEVATGTPVEIAQKLAQIMAPVEAIARGRALYENSPERSMYGEIEGD